MKVLQVTPSFYPATNFGGTISSGYGLCNALAQIRGVELRVLTTDSNGPSLDDRIPLEESMARLPAGYCAYYFRHRWYTTFAPEMFLRLWSEIRWSDVVHLTGVYCPPTIPTLFICKILKKPVVWSPRGALQHWEGTTRRYVKKSWEAICNLLCAQERVMLHVTSEDESVDSLKRLSRARAEIIPNGIDLPADSFNREWQPQGQTRLLYLGRLHPIKGIENLLRALERMDKNVTLAICGEGDAAYQKSLEQLAEDLSLQSRVRFYGKVEGEEKLRRFREADVCVAPSYKENFCMVVAESLALGVPVIAGKGTPWSRLETIGCGLWVDNDPENLARAVERIKEMPLREMGQRGREWMQREFSWAEAAEKMIHVYQKLLQSPYGKLLPQE